MVMHVKKMKLLSPLIAIVKSLSHFILQECICFLILWHLTPYFGQTRGFGPMSMDFVDNIIVF